MIHGPFHNFPVRVHLAFVPLGSTGVSLNTLFQRSKHSACVTAFTEDAVELRKDKAAGLRRVLHDNFIPSRRKRELCVVRVPVNSRSRRSHRGLVVCIKTNKVVDRDFAGVAVARRNVENSPPSVIVVIAVKPCNVGYSTVKLRSWAVDTDPVANLKIV
jgi:hypothetical protein